MPLAACQHNVTGLCQRQRKAKRCTAIRHAPKRLAFASAFGAGSFRHFFQNPSQRFGAPRPSEREARKPWAGRDAGDAPKKPWRKAEDAAPRDDGYKPRSEGGYKPRAEGDYKPRAPRGEGEYKPRAPCGEGEYKPRAPRAVGEGEGGKPAYRSTGFKSHGGKDGPGRATGYKSHAAEGGASRGEGRSYTPREGKPAGDRPYGKPAGARPEGGKCWGSKSQGDKPYGAKPFGAKSAGKPARPAGDAKDTSKRFTPPKRPRG